jgi:hypothetical protein
MIAEWAIPFIFIIAAAMWIGLVFLKPRNLDDELQDREHIPGICGCYGCRQEWADEQTPRRSQMDIEGKEGTR